MKKFILLVASAMLCLLSGCALTNESVNLNYSPNLTKLKKVSSSKTLDVGKFQDQRGTNPRLVMHKINLNEQEAQGMYLAEKPITSVLKNAINKALMKSGYNIAKNGRYVLSGNLLGLDMKPIEGFIHYKYKCNIQLEVILSDKVTRKELWEETYNGVGYFQSKTDQGEPISIAFSRAANDLVHKFLNDPGFRRIMS